MNAESPSRRLVLGTRGSALALQQTALARQALCDAVPALEVEQRIFTTTGDKRPELNLTEFSRQNVIDKGIFIKELELALADGAIDMAVHSAKDVPTTLDPRFLFAAVLPREPVHDILITRKPVEDGIRSLPPGACIATSSVRRQRQLQWMRPDVRVAEIRGNVLTRVWKLVEQKELDGIMLAFAGLKRLGHAAEDSESLLVEKDTLHITHLDPATFLPAAGQGAVALEIRAGDASCQKVAEAVNDMSTWVRVAAERAFLARLEAGCHTPVGVHSRFDAGRVHLHVRVFAEGAPPEEEPAEAEASGLPGEEKQLADELMEKIGAAPADGKART